MSQTITREPRAAARPEARRRDKLIAELKQIDEQKKLADSVPKKTRAELLAEVVALRDARKKEYSELLAQKRQLEEEVKNSPAKRLESVNNKIRFRHLAGEPEEFTRGVAALQAATVGFLELRSELRATSSRSRDEELANRGDVERCRQLHDRAAAIDRADKQLSSVLLLPDAEQKVRDLRSQLLATGVLP